VGRDFGGGCSFTRHYECRKRRPPRKAAATKRNYKSLLQNLVGGGDGLLAFGDGRADGEKFVAAGVTAEGG